MLQHITDRNIVSPPIPIHLGAFLKMLRDRHGITQIQVLKHLPFWDQSVYSRVEKDKVAPSFEQLPHIYEALHRAGVILSLQDRQQFLLLARRKIEAMRTRHEHRSETEWDELRVALAQVDHLPAEAAGWQGRSRKPHVAKPRFAETRHLVGREEWLASIVKSLQGSHPKKLVVIQGPVGMGKSSELNRLATYFIRQEFPRCHVIPCALPRHIDSELALDEFLGTLLVELGPGYESMFASLSLEERMLLVLGYIERTAAPLILLLDNAENLLEEGGVLATCWEQFLVKFLRYEHQASLVLATSEWHGWFTGEQLFVTQTMLPALSPDDGVVLLQQLGLSLIPVKHLRAAVEAVGGVPQCLEWVASLVQEPMLTDEWDGVLDQREEEGAGELEQAEMLAHRLQRLLEDSSLFGGPIAIKLKPLLKRVIEQRLSTEARAALNVLAVASLPLGKPALQALCARPAPLKELRDSSLLVAYPHRVQLLPMVASTVLHQFSSEQVQTAEEQLIRAYTHWLEEGSAMSKREKGMIFTELVCLLMSHHRLLATAELVLYHGWLSFHAGQILRLARRVQQVFAERPWTSPETDIEAESGALLLHYYLAPYLGEMIEAEKRREDYERIYAWITTGQLQVEPLMEVHLVDHLMINCMNEDRYEEAQRLLEGCFTRLESLLPGDEELHATLLSKQASLYSEWSGYAESHGQMEEMKRKRSQTIEAYEESFALLQRAEQEEGLRPLQQDTIKKKQASVLNNLAYQLNRAGRFAEALPTINHCIDLKKQGYADLDSLAASYGEKSQTLAALGDFEEALRFDELAREEIGRSADAGDTRSQADRWIYQVNQACLYLLLGRSDEAERLLRETLSVKTQRRKIYKMLAEEALKEIENARAASPDARFQLDWRWVGRYRWLSAYDAYWWWAPAGPFIDEEQRQWEKVFAPGMGESVKDQLREILMQSRDRELSMARAEHREPRFSYPALDIAEVRQRIADFLQLDAEIAENEPNVVVRRLYHGAIEDEVCFLRLIEATHEGKDKRFWELTRQLYPEPTSAEMQYALEQVRQLLLQGLKLPETEAASAIEQGRRDARQEACQKVIEVLRDQFHLSLDLSGEPNGDFGAVFSPPSDTPLISAQGAKRFFEAVLQSRGHAGWHVILDPNVAGPRVETGLRQVFLPAEPIPLDELREYLSHELAGHVARSIAGENSPLGLLGISTKGYMVTEEGLADYYERQAAAVHGDPVDDSGIWLGTLAIGLACGVAGPAQTFSSLLAFFEPFLLLYRLLWRDDEDRQTAERRAQRNAFTRCLRTFRGVPDLARAGICNTKDVVYLRGRWLIDQAVAQDETVLDRLAVGKVAYELLPELEKLGITAPSQSFRALVLDPDLDAYILSFEHEGVRE